MKKEYEAPFCKVITVETKDILTGSYVEAQKVTDEPGDLDGGAIIQWGKW